MDSVFTRQHWSAYTVEQHAVWATLYRRRMASLHHSACRVFLDGARLIGLGEDCIPDLDEVNRRLGRRSGWSAVPVKGFLPAREFFGCLGDRRFPTTVTIRSAEQLDYVPEPDIFHDVFGHVPLHADPVFAGFLQRFGALAAAAEGEEQVTRLARLFWFTVEFGLVRESGDVRIYGSGLISSHADAAHALSHECRRRPFDLEVVMAQPFEIDHLQDTLFVVESFEQLFAAVAVAGELLQLPRLV